MTTQNNKFHLAELEQAEDQVRCALENLIRSAVTTASIAKYIAQEAAAIGEHIKKEHENSDVTVQKVINCAAFEANKCAKNSQEQSEKVIGQSQGLLDLSQKSDILEAKQIENYPFIRDTFLSFKLAREAIEAIIDSELKIETAKIEAEAFDAQKEADARADEAQKARLKAEAKVKAATEALNEANQKMIAAKAAAEAKAAVVANAKAKLDSSRVLCPPFDSSATPEAAATVPTAPDDIPK